VPVVGVNHLPAPAYRRPYVNARYIRSGRGCHHGISTRSGALRRSSRGSTAAQRAQAIKHQVRDDIDNARRPQDSRRPGRRRVQETERGMDGDGELLRAALRVAPRQAVEPPADELLLAGVEAPPEPVADGTVLAREDAGELPVLERVLRVAAD